MQAAPGSGSRPRAASSYPIGRSVALAYLRADLARPGERVQILIFGELRPATVGKGAPYDPGNARLKA